MTYFRYDLITATGQKHELSQGDRLAALMASARDIAYFRQSKNPVTKGSFHAGDKLLYVLLNEHWVSPPPLTA